MTAPSAERLEIRALVADVLHQIRQDAEPTPIYAAVAAELGQP